ncbi:MAG TPA: TIGR03545 family protein [Gemmatimonadales bacterium]
MQVKIFRWKAIGPLILFLVIITVLVILFAEPVARDTTEEVSTEMLGTQVDVGKLNLHPTEPAVDLDVLQIADPFNPNRNLIEAAEIRLKLNAEALTEKKVVVERFALNGMRFGTTRKTPARPVKGNGFAPQLLRSVRQWSQQFNVPLLKLTPIDTIKQLVLNPTQLATVKQAQALVGRTDSTRQALEQGFKNLNVEGTVDSARALAARLAATDPKKLGVQGTKDAIQSVQQTLRQLDDAKKRVEGLERGVKSGVQTLGAGVQSLDSTRRQDYAFARSLLKLPSFDAPDIGKAFFGKVSIERVQQALYWAQLAQHYMPPGLLPRQEPGPKRLRMAGTNVQFPKEHHYPDFLLQLGQLDFAIEGDNPLKGAYQAVVRGVTTTPALYGRPMTVTASRRAAGSAIAGIDVNAVIDHVTSNTRDSLAAQLAGVRLPAFDLPGIPFRVAPGVGVVKLNFALRRDQLAARWAVASNQVSWTPDTAARRFNDIERAVWRVVSGLKDLQIDARVTGSVRSPNLSVSSNLDDAIASRLKAVIGEEVAKAERMARAKVDSLVQDKVEPVKQRVAAVQADATKRVAGQKQQLDQVQQELNSQLKRLTAGLAPGIKLPKIKF